MTAMYPEPLSRTTALTYSNNPKTKRAQKTIEKTLLHIVKRRASERRLFQPMQMTRAWWNAMDRLLLRGVVRRAPFGVYVPTAKGKRSTR